MTMCKFYMRNGTVIEVMCEKLTVKVNQITNELVGYSIENAKDGLPLYIDIKEIIAVKSIEKEQDDTAIETESTESWISVYDRMPKSCVNDYHSDYVLFIYHDEIHMGRYDYQDDEWYSDSAQCRIAPPYVLYWMPLPELPGKEAES